MTPPVAVAVAVDVRAIRDLPSLPVIVLELLSTMDAEATTVQTLAYKISQDQALAAKTLRLANSSFYGRPSAVVRIEQAIAMIGFRTIRSLVIAASLTTAFSRPAGGNFDFDCFWQHAIGTAVCARHIAAVFNISPDSAFIAGLLHDIGQLVLATHFAASSDAARLWRDEHDCSTVEAEQETAGMDHAGVGEALAAHWRFPAAIRDAIAHHHDAVAGLPLVVRLADAIAHALDLAGDPLAAVPVIDDGLWSQLAIAPGRLVNMLRDIEVEHREIAKVLLQ